MFSCVILDTGRIEGALPPAGMKLTALGNMAKD